MGLRAADDSDYFIYIRVALLSAREKAPSLVPYLIYSGPANTMTAWFEQHGGTVIFHDLSFFADLREDMKSHASGPYLRLDVPSITSKLEHNDHIDHNHVLYTDVDVMFMSDIDSCSLEAPDICAIGGESTMGTKANTGVMYMSIKGFSAHIEGLVAFAKEHNWAFPAYDQGLILAYFDQDKLAQLPDTFNWKGYWGSPGSKAPSIVHWHGPKPRRNLGCLLENILYRDSMSADKAAEVCEIKIPDYAPIVWNTLDHGAYYNHILQIFETYVLQKDWPRVGSVPIAA